jgi:uncharacterized protein YycO
MSPTIKVIFGKNHLPFSWLIRIFTWSRWSHCGIVVGDMVFEATATKGVVITPINDFIKRYNDHAFANVIVRDSVADAYDRLAGEVGKKYDFSAIFGILFRTGWNANNKWFCSELVAYVVGTYRDNNLGRITPEMIWSNSK